MDTDKNIKEIVKEKYGQIAVNNSGGCCCGCGSTQNVEFTIMQDDYTGKEGYVAEADLQLGCGMPTEFAAIKKGDTVVDLGSGAGNDVFIARSLVGEEGKVIGIDFTPEMLEKANKNNSKLGYKNVEFKMGEIENIPLASEIVDVVVSNCVLNLVPDKKKAFSEIFRILKVGAHFCVSDIVIKGDLPDELKKSAEMYAGCVAGALPQQDYLDIIEKAGFKNVEIKRTKTIDLPDEILKDYLSEDKIKEFKKKDTGIFSITVVGEK